MTAHRLTLLAFLFPSVVAAQAATGTTWMSLQGAPNIALSLRGSYQFASLNDWRQQFSPLPSSMLTGVGLEASYDGGSSLVFGVGYEYFFGQKVTDDATGVQDQITAGFLYAAVRTGTYLDELKALFLYGDVDVGTMSAKESVKLYGINHEATGSTLAVRPKGGLLVFVNPFLSASLEIGYLVGNVKGAQFSGSVVPTNYALSGLYLAATLNYHIPL